MKRSVIASSLIAVALAFVATSTIAHTGLASTSPKSGSVLRESPPVIEITFESAVRMTSAVLIDAHAAERKLSFEPTGAAAKAFQISDPKLAAGRNQIKWKALSADGHVVSGTIVLVIEPAAP